MAESYDPNKSIIVQVRLQCFTCVFVCFFILGTGISISRAQSRPMETEVLESIVVGRPWVDQFNSPGLGFDQWGTPFEQRFTLPDHGELYWDLGFATRGYYINDQRIEFTGLESTFGVEGVLRGNLIRQVGDRTALVYGEFFLNQRFDSNVLTDSPLRESFANNFDIDTLEISQLSFLVRRSNWEFEIGRFVTPFGRYYGLSSLNHFFDLPFIRMESILARETGVLLRWSPGLFSSTVAVTNGGPQKDSNSSKALVARWGADLQRWSFGASVKKQDGIGSEGQKEIKNHYGIDWMFRLTPDIFLSGEILYDEYGLRRPGTPLDEINWGRSLYNRQLNNGLNRPITGWGYYINVVGRHSHFDWSVEVGQFFPDPVGDLTHDTRSIRGSGQVYWHLGPLCDWFASFTIENSIDGLQHVPRSKGTAYASGIQFRF